MDKLDFSVIVPYNGVGNLTSTLNAIANQNFVTYEIIIVTKHNSFVIVPPQFKSFVKIVEEVHPSVFGALNVGLDVANGSYSYFLTCGALFINEQVLYRIKILMASNSDAIYVNGGWNQERKSGVVSKFPGIRIKHFYHFWSIQHMNLEALCVRNSAIINLRFDEQFKVAADFKFLRSLTKLGKGRALEDIFVQLPPPGISGSTSSIGENELDMIRIKTLSEYFGPFARPIHKFVKYSIRFFSFAKNFRSKLIATYHKI